MSSKSPSFNAHLIEVGFDAVNTDTSIAHDLGRTPLAVFTLLAGSKATRIYKGSVAWTSTTISLRSSVASTSVTLMLV